MLTNELVQKIRETVESKGNWHFRIKDKSEKGKGSCTLTIVTDSFDVILVDIDSNDNVHKDLLEFADLSNSSIDDEDQKIDVNVDSKGIIQSVLIKACFIKIDYKQLDLTIEQPLKNIYQTDKYSMDSEKILDVINNLSAYYFI